MGPEIDIPAFLHDLMATKPPYDCPFPGCGKTYKSHPGISLHVQNAHRSDHSEDVIESSVSRRRGRSVPAIAASARSRSLSGSDAGAATAREALTYAEAQRMIEVEMDGRTHRINITEKMDIVKYDKSIPIEGLTDLPLTAAAAGPVTLALENGNAASSNGKGAKNGTHSRSTKSKSGKKGTHTGKSCSKSVGKSCKSGVQSVIPEKPKLPEASYRVVDEPIEAPDAVPRSAAYFRFIEKSPEELDESVEYDMDEEDCAWLELINKTRKSNKYSEIQPDVFEMLMDRLEKESYFLSQNSKDPVAQVIDENAVCCICNDGDCQNSNAILFCDMCDLAVHQECYGVPYIPEGQWLCRRCLHSPSAAVDCILCPNKGGAFKQTDKAEWAHVVCALWIPEVCFANTVFLEPIDSVANIPAARWRLLCYICKQKNVGACIQCHKPNCYVAFHVTCAQSAGLYMKIDFDKSGAQSIRKAAYCHTHTPADEAAGTQALSGVYITGDTDDDTSRTSFKSKKKSCPKSLPDKGVVNESEFKEKIRKTRKILAEKRSELPKVSIPTIPPDRLTSIAAKVQVPKRNQFIQRLLGYWTLKRQHRNGVPLLRRLQISYMGNRRAETFDTDSEQIRKTREVRNYVVRLRQDLEKARLLVEQIRKREKLKRLLIEAQQEEVEFRMTPFRHFLLHVLSQLETKDTNKFFAEPVSEDDAPDYREFIFNPMDFSTMRDKVNRHLYSSFDEFEHDFNLIIQNCKEYNEDTTPYHKAANKLRDNCRPIFSEARRLISVIGYNEAAGIHMSDDITANTITQMYHRNAGTTSGTVLALCAPPPHEPEDDEPDEVEADLLAQMADLKAAMSKAFQQKSGGSRSKKIKLLQTAMDEINDKLHHVNPDRYPLLTEEEKLEEQKRRRDEATSKPAASSIAKSSQKMLALTDAPAVLSEFESPAKPDSRRRRNTDRTSETGME
jgi:bromodomain and PHD finger-containing protein 1